MLMFEKVISQRLTNAADPKGTIVAEDPICRMKVAEAEAKYTTTYDGKKFYFCSAACKQQFDRNPTKYSK